jgi:hypothetical protein
VLGIQQVPVEAESPLPTGAHQVRMELAYDGGGLAKGGDVTLYYDGEPVGKGRVGATQAPRTTAHRHGQAVAMRAQARAMSAVLSDFSDRLAPFTAD